MVFQKSTSGFPRESASGLYRSQITLLSERRVFQVKTATNRSDGATISKQATGAALTFMALVCFLVPAHAAAARINIDVISSKADRVTGGDALMTVDLAPGVNQEKLGIRLNGTGIRSSFSPTSGDRRHLTGLVSGFRPGPNRITAWAPGVNAAVIKRVFNSPDTGPVFPARTRPPIYAGLPRTVSASRPMATARHPPGPSTSTSRPAGKSSRLPIRQSARSTWHEPRCPMAAPSTT